VRDDWPIIPPQQRRAFWVEARGILNLLGFRGFSDFARQSAISHATISKMFYGDGVLRLRMILRAHETLHSAYEDRRETLRAAQRSAICDWARRWQMQMAARLQYRLPGAWSVTNPYELRRRKKYHRAHKAAVRDSLAALKWRT
jgi:hypothetical protein